MPFRSLKNEFIGPEYEIFVLIAYAKKPPLNALADTPSGVRSLNFGPSLHVQPCVCELQMFWPVGLAFMA